MSRFSKIVLAVLLCMPSVALAETDFQFRPLVHKQGNGWAAWVGAPNTEAPGHTKTMVLGGVATAEGGSWAEVLAGGLFGSPDGTHPVASLRAYATQKDGALDGYADALYDFSTDRFVALANSTRLLADLGRVKVRGGLESELVVLGGELAAADIGPRLAFPFRTSPSRRPSAIAFAYRWRIDGEGADVFRAYAVIELSRKRAQ